MISDSAISRVLGEEGPNYVHLVDTILEDCREFKYWFMPMQEYKSLLEQGRLHDAMYVYWIEIVYRAHFASISSLARSRRWISGFLSGSESNNALAFFGCFRGFLESISDTNDALEPVPLELAQIIRHIKKALSRELDVFLQYPDLEERLIHYSHARRKTKGEDLPKDHVAKSANDYLKSLDDGNHPEILECYAELCNFAHPSADTVIAFMDLFTNDVNEQGINVLNLYPDRKYIDEFTTKYAKTTPYLLSMGIIPPVATLKILSTLRLRELRIPFIETVSLTEWPAWRRVENALKGRIPLNYLR